MSFYQNEKKNKAVNKNLTHIEKLKASQIRMHFLSINMLLQMEFSNHIDYRYSTIQFQGRVVHEKVLLEDSICKKNNINLEYLTHSFNSIFIFKLTCLFTMGLPKKLIVLIVQKREILGSFSSTAVRSGTGYCGFVKTHTLVF